MRLVESRSLLWFFAAGVALRFATVFWAFQALGDESLYPLLDVPLASPELWTTGFLNNDSGLVLPHEYGMFLISLVFILPLTLVGMSAEIVMLILFLIADAAVLAILVSLYKDEIKLVFVLYWCSPLVIIATYGLGFSDVFSVLFAILSIWLLRSRRMLLAGTAAGAAVFVKLSMLMLLPLITIYVLRNKTLVPISVLFFYGFSMTVCLTILPPILFAPTLASMMLSPLDVANVLALQIEVGEIRKIYILPMFYFCLIAYLSSLRRMNFNQLVAGCGVAFTLMVVCTPVSLGWYLMGLPFLIGYLASGSMAARGLFIAFSCFVVLSSLVSINELLSISGIDKVFYIGTEFQLFENVFIHTALFVVGSVMIANMIKEAILGNDFYRLTKSPFLIGIAGDSGSGKDTLAESLVALFGSRSVTTLSGDDYHLWDRNKPMWSVITHLNPRANDLESFTKDVMTLADGRDVSIRVYDHDTGKRSTAKRLRSNDFVIASGLHAMLHPSLERTYSLTIYLDIDEELRRFWKVRRDVTNRGHTFENVLRSIQLRERDSQKFVHGQKEKADLVFCLKPMKRLHLPDWKNSEEPKLRLEIESASGYRDSTLIRELVGLCGLHVNYFPNYGEARNKIIVDGEVHSEDIALSAVRIAPGLEELLDLEPT